MTHWSATRNLVGEPIGRRCASSPTPLTALLRAALALLCALTLTSSLAAPVMAWQDAPPSLPMPPPPPARPPVGFSTAVTEFARIHVEPGAEVDAAAFARDWGLLIDDAIGQLASFLPPPRNKVDLYVYTSRASFAVAAGAAPVRELAPGDVIANPHLGDIAVNYEGFARRSPLEAENLLRHALSHVVAREA